LLDYGAPLHGAGNRIIVAHGYTNVSSLPSRPVWARRRSLRTRVEFGRVEMTWKVEQVQTTLDGPGFIVQREGRPPSLIIAFEDKETANRCAEMMRAIIAKAKMITGT
jgi:hypothetical protein